MKGDASILWLAANFDDPGDGVGKYAARMVDAVRLQLPEHRIVVASARTIDLGRWRRFASGRMAGCILSAADRINSGGVGAVVVEYPFLEQSPVILPAMSALRRACTRSGVEMIVSLHEYGRVGRLRQWSIRLIAGMADKVLATDAAMAGTVRRWTRGRVSIREIPSNIPRAEGMGGAARDPRGFCFFGVVNRSKAFDPMLRGWQEARSAEMVLHVLTASTVNVSCPGVVIHRGLEDGAVARMLASNSFLVLPILPAVETNSGSLKAGLVNGLIPLGRPGETLGTLRSSFVSVDSYTPECFAHAFRTAASMRDAEREALSGRLVAEGARWSVEHSASQVVNALLGTGR